MHSTWNAEPSARSLRPTTSATRPPMPASTSSKIRPGADALGGRSVGVAEAVPRGRRQRLDREHDARQLAARDDARQRPEVLARDSARRRTPPRRSRRARPRRLRAAARRRTGPRTACAPSPARRAALRARSRTPSATRRRSVDSVSRGGDDTRRGPPRASRSSSAIRSSPRVEVGQLAPQRVAPRDDVGERRPVLALQPLEQRQPLLDLLQPRRRRLDAVGVPAQEAARGPRAAT